MGINTYFHRSFEQSVTLGDYLAPFFLWDSCTHIRQLRTWDKRADRSVRVRFVDLCKKARPRLLAAICVDFDGF
jgi:hypothetical protein